MLQKKIIKVQKVRELPGITKQIKFIKQKRKFSKNRELTRRSPVPGKYSPYLWNDAVMTLSVV